jgi:hypothetical protein
LNVFIYKILLKRRCPPHGTRKGSIEMVSRGPLRYSGEAAPAPHWHDGLSRTHAPFRPMSACESRWPGRPPPTLRKVGTTGLGRRNMRRRIQLSCRLDSWRSPRRGACVCFHRLAGCCLLLYLLLPVTTRSLDAGGLRCEVGFCSL